MSLKQFLTDKYGTEFPELAGDELHDSMDEYAKSYALQIAREAVEEEKNQIRAEGFVEGSARNSAYVALLTRIKKLTEES